MTTGAGIVVQLSDRVVIPFIIAYFIAGSGAPFHFHCNAINYLVYGRKK